MRVDPDMRLKNLRKSTVVNMLVEGGSTVPRRAEGSPSLFQFHPVQTNTLNSCKLVDFDFVHLILNLIEFSCLKQDLANNEF